MKRKPRSPKTHYIIKANPVFNKGISVNKFGLPKGTTLKKFQKIGATVIANRGIENAGRKELQGYAKHFKKIQRLALNPNRQYADPKIRKLLAQNHKFGLGPVITNKKGEYTFQVAKKPATRMTAKNRELKDRIDKALNSKYGITKQLDKQVLAKHRAKALEIGLGKKDKLLDSLDKTKGDIVSSLEGVDYNDLTDKEKIIMGVFGGAESYAVSVRDSLADISDFWIKFGMEIDEE